LVEEQRTNLVTDNTTDFNYSINNQSIATANDVAPDGNTVLCKHDLTGASEPFLNCNVGATLTPGTYTMSMWLKGTTSFSASFAFVGGNEIYSNTANITTTWQRFTLTFTLINTRNNSRLQVFFGTQGENKVISIWGAQLESGAFATSYIPRPVAGQQATRNPDNVSMVGENFSSWYNQSEGTLFASIRNQTVRSSLSYDAFVSIAGTDKDRNVMRIYTQTAPGGGAPYAFFGAVAYSPDGSTVLNHIDTYTSNIQNIGKAALAYKKNDYAFTSHGAIPNTTSSGEVPTCNQLLIFGRSRFQLEPSGHIAQLTYYPRRLTNSQLQNLTK
jgi:hypothetical protein